ncbi:MAG: alpha/beta fold hydrolase [Euzebya sp.]
MKTIDVGTARLAAWDDGAGPVLVALHAGVADSRVWRDSAAVWQAQGWRVVTYDRRGYGESSWQPESFSHVEDLFAVMNAMEIDSAVLVGNSMGGRTALDAALDRPDRINGLVLVAAGITGAPKLDPADFEPNLAALDAELDQADESGDLDLVNTLEAHLWLDGPLQPRGRVSGAARELFLDMNGRALAAPDVGEGRWGPSAWERLEQVTQPTVVVTGDFDVTQSNDLLITAASRMPDARHIALSGSAHLPMLDDPQAFHDAVSPFLTPLR